MADRSFTKGLHELGDGLFAYLQPDGGWGLSNSGLIAGEGASLLVDTLFDLQLTRELLDALAPITGTRPIETVFNTHGNGDHCYGNQLAPERAEIYASVAASEEMAELPPAAFHALLQMDLGEELNAFARAAFGAFRFDDIELRPPTQTFSGSLSVIVGGRGVELIELGPAHTRGDTIAFVPDARAAFTGDILFIGSTPIVWAGPVSNWLAACDALERLDADVFIPGHGPLTDRRGVAGVRRYLEFVRDEAGRRHEAGIDTLEAALDIELGEFADWRDPERIVVNVEAIYRELDPDRPLRTPLELFGQMASYRARR